MTKQQKVLQIAARKEEVFKALIVGRDSLSSALLAETLMHSLGWNAIAMQSADLLKAAGTSEPFLLIISSDVSSKLGSGFDLAARISSAHPNASIVILLDSPTREAVIKAFHSGARGVFYRQEPIADFIDCVEHVRRGSIWAGREVSDIFLETFRCLPAPSSPMAGDSKSLTKRELQVVQCAARGKPNKVIASELFLSEHTVKNYLFRAFEKLGVSSRVELLFHLTMQGQSLAPSKAVEEKPAETELV
jgi:two-component system nitrate/nitrite response regulator NarL